MLRAGDEQGFTLLEVLVVLLIGTIFFLLAYPSSTYLVSRWRLRAEANRIASLLHLAQSRSLTRGRRYGVAFDLEGKRVYSLVTFEAGEQQVVEDFELETGVHFGAETVFGQQNLFLFSPQGYVSSAGTLELVLECGQRIYVIVAAVTGRIRISNIR